MSVEQVFVRDLTIVLGAAALGGYLTNRLRQPVFLGYLASGLLVGPFGLGLVSDAPRIQALAELGVAFLLFALGVEFSISELKRVQNIAIQGSLLQIGLTAALVACLTTLGGWVNGWEQGIFVGAILSLSSTAVVLKTLTERGETATVHGQIMLAILIAQDLALGLMLAVLPALQQPQGIWQALGLALLKVVLFLLGAIALGRWFVPRFIRQLAITNSNELFLLGVIALCLGIALITERLGLSIAMGAFVAGLMIAEIDYSDQALAKVLPLRDTFASLFFASIGMLINPVVLAQNFSIILELVLLVMVGKASIILPIILRFGYSLKTALKTSLGINQIGEFSFVLALLGRDLGMLSERTYLLLLGTTAITLILTPFSINSAPRVLHWLQQFPPLKGWFQQLQEPKLLSVPEHLRDHVVVAGYGRVGHVIVQILLEQGHTVLVLENNEAAVQNLRHQGIPYIFGDADSEQVLDKAHIETAQALAIALPDPNSTRLLLKHALERAPGLDVIARSHTDHEIDLLTQFGAREVVQPEFEAALELGSHLLETLGTAEPQIRAVISGIRRDRYQSIRS